MWFSKSEERHSSCLRTQCRSSRRQEVTTSQQLHHPQAVPCAKPTFSALTVANALTTTSYTLRVNLLAGCNGSTQRGRISTTVPSATESSRSAKLCSSILDPNMASLNSSWGAENRNSLQHWHSLDSVMLLPNSSRVMPIHCFQRQWHTSQQVKAERSRHKVGP